MATKRTKTTRKQQKKSSSGLAKVGAAVPTLPVVAKAARSIPTPVLMFAAGACAVGALAYLMLAGAAGQRRRELIRTKALQAGETISKGSREVRQRIESVAMEAAKRVRGGRDGMANGLSGRRTTEPALHP